MATSTEHMRATAGPWHLRNADGRLPIVREIKRPYGEASHYEATIGTGNTLSGPVVVKLDFGYGAKSDATNARMLAAAWELHHWVAEVLERCMLDDRAKQVADDLEAEARQLLARIAG
jgi:hypothetical protein